MPYWNKSFKISAGSVSLVLRSVEKCSRLPLMLWRFNYTLKKKNIMVTHIVVQHQGNTTRTFSGFLQRTFIFVWIRNFHKMPRDTSTNPSWLMVPTPGLDRLRKVGMAPASQSWQWAGLLESMKRKVWGIEVWKERRKGTRLDKTKNFVSCRKS